MDSPENMRTAAARNNADWCHVMARSRGIQGKFTSSVWVSDVRTPLFYPDAVTLSEQANAADILSAIDTTSGCSVKDSFACLDLTAAGFSVLFEAEWFYSNADRTSYTNTSTREWSRVLTSAQLAEWQTAWASDGDPDTFRPALLDEGSVAVLAGRSNGVVVAGAVLNQSAAVVGISNVFVGDEMAESVWPDLIEQAATLFPDHWLVGYESGEALESAKAAGFRSAGPLRVWIKELDGTNQELLPTNTFR